jgi:hypothetical protein
MPAGIWLNKFGVIVRDYFGHVPVPGRLIA